MERVFPIRCNILDTSQHLSGEHQKQEVDKKNVFLVHTLSSPQQNATPSPPDPTATETSSPASRRISPHAASDTSSRTPGSHLSRSSSFLRGTSRSTRNSPAVVYTEPSEYAFTKQEGHGVVSGKPPGFTRCEDEQIHIPGAIQSHGMLIGLRIIQQDAPRYVCDTVSENAYAICKYSTKALMAMDDFIQVFPSYQRAEFHSNAAAVTNLYHRCSESFEPKVFSTCIKDPEDSIIPLWCAMHFVGVENILVCEFEPEEVTVSGAFRSPDVLDEDFGMPSFINKTEPLQLVGTAIDMFQRGRNPMQLLNAICSIQRQLSSQPDMQQLLDTILDLMKQVTGFSRCMVYRFDEWGNGQVVSEILEPGASLDTFQGLHFPASDIPSQARELYMINRVRVLFDREQPTCRLIHRAESSTAPLDLTHSYLRAMSPVHLRYLCNMAVRSSLSVSLECGGKLWGLVCCHSYGSSGLKVPFPVRELCYWLGLSASSCIDRLLHASRIEARKYLSAMQINISPTSWVTASSNDLLRLFEADFGFLVVQGEARTIGHLSSYREAVTLLKYVYFRNFENTHATCNVNKDFSDLEFEGGFDQIAGLLFIPLSQAIGDFIVFFRANQTKVLHWAGNPQKAMVEMEDGSRLEPRNSFKQWTEIVNGTCGPWTEEQFEAAAMTRLVYGNFMYVWREKEAAVQESRMKRMLLLNLSHEVRTPMNAIVNYLEIALGGSLDKRAKEALSISHQASKSVIYVIDDLLNLTSGQTQPNPALIQVALDLHRGVESILDPLKAHAYKKFLSFDIIKDIAFPRFVHGDLPRLQQAVTCLVTNAIESTAQGGIIVHLGMLSADEEHCVIRISVQDSGKGMTEAELDGLFRDFEQVSDEKDHSKGTLAQGDQASDDPLPEKNNSRVGVGLARLARFVKHSNGQVRGVSRHGQGSTFSIELPLQLAEETPSLAAARTHSLVSASQRRSGAMSGMRSPSSQGPSLASRRLPRMVDFSPNISAPSSPVSREISFEAKVLAKEHLTVLVADDCPINVAILKRRLTMMGHKVKPSRDGQECYDVFQECRDEVDFVLMDLMMPLVHGLQATAQIRAFEGLQTLMSSQHPARGEARAETHKRVPIFAVSATLETHTQASLEKFGFDGCLPKPIDFKRLDVLLKGVESLEARSDGLFDAGKPRAGGWFKLA